MVWVPQNPLMMWLSGNILMQSIISTSWLSANRSLREMLSHHVRYSQYTVRIDLNLCHFKIWRTLLVDFIHFEKKHKGEVTVLNWMLNVRLMTGKYLQHQRLTQRWAGSLLPEQEPPNLLTYLWLFLGKCNVAGIIGTSALTSRHRS